ncbi:MAG TPA: DUF3492 domain-containing protein [Candidatus Bathyarchaeota archaeon]|nr:MAG: DUF3492 domain-containing protein [Candidatus Bathyarchaeota archaeon]HDN01798.1 DUF3492 domain-containing protein [Candidatus Bathyarchaeota archaeon]
MRVLMSTEGTYPFFRGGVSTWTHNLISNLEEFKFTILALVANPYVNLAYKLPRNVEKVIMFPIWGVDVVGEYVHESYFKSVKPKPSRENIKNEFIPELRRLVSEVKSGGKNPKSLGESLYSIHHFLLRYDFKSTFRSEYVWKAFSDELSMDDPLYSRLKASYLVRAGRILQHILRVLTIEVPEVDLCHSSVASLCSIPAVILKLKYGTPYLLTEHGVFFRERLLDLVSGAKDIIDKYFWLNLCRSIVRLNYFYADRILPVCRFNIQWEEEFDVPPERVEVIYNGVDVNRFKPIPKLESDKPLIVVMARIDKLKDLTNIIEAMSYVVDEVPDATCEIFGPIDDEDYYNVCLNFIEKLDLHEHVIFKGLTKTPEVEYNRAKVVAQPSISEGFPFSVVEAMSCGKTVVATDVGGVREALEGCGIIVPARSPKALAEALIKVLKNEKLRMELGKKARMKVLKNFSYQRFLTEYRRVYVEAITTRKLEV